MTLFKPICVGRIFAVGFVLAVCNVCTWGDELQKPASIPPPRLEFGFPSPPPIANANPSLRHEINIHVPTKFTVERERDSMIVTADLAGAKAENITVGENMATGMEYTFVAYPKDGNPPLVRAGGALTSAIEFGGAHHVFNRILGAIPNEGTEYVVEMRWKIFETDIPAQHFWSPNGRGSKYKVLLEGTVKQIIQWPGR